MTLKINVVCTSGLGTSLMIRIHLEALLREQGLRADIEHMDVASLGLSPAADLIVGAHHIADSLPTRLLEQAEWIPLENMTDRNYLRTKLMESPRFLAWREREKGSRE
ncbi:hypothetical protein C8Z91_08950 [Paenibacillus elgii]|uniref:Phosphotransferase system EIIB component type 2/3 domain-containing protein n=1 Tax=Paenibacillus elgii TaxID=189691 RepID=A0A2T6G5W1_9BACL|nr:PTS sugar transporter subunit IIB [Paenibacillus elgii]PUA39544.1 hypothetical protein C8Z91_08950 [Paenibacillus elgii]